MEMPNIAADFFMNLITILILSSINNEKIVLCNFCYCKSKDIFSVLYAHKYSMDKNWNKLGCEYFLDIIVVNKLLLDLRRKQDELSRRLKNLQILFTFFEFPK